ncbi:cytochrome c5 family protein [Marinomonas sp. M1K-6]|uniref:Cytochrome c5 family protein n=2 Tax=Marinomonas profundi TaxID=2726122 RepID=A0A847R465_9GAMM|nr:cytochrome c5 family protein [Marinomonas profundi]UDV04820.1 cytochrome c5 family protein [Marinomonas profundi]
MHSQAANADAPHNNQSTKPYKGRAVEQIYNTYCIACHMSGVAGAPRFGHAEDWQPHVDKGIEVLLEHVITGFKAMPPRGICSDCSDEELLHTIHYMIDQSQ